MNLRKARLTYVQGIVNGDSLFIHETPAQSIVVFFKWVGCRGGKNIFCKS